MHYPLEHDLSFDLDLLQSGSGITLLQDLSNYEIHQADVWKTSELSDGESTGSSSASAPSKTGKVAKARTKYTHSLSDSDRELLREEGYSIPEIMTKDDEKVLRQLRRKIKNKMIASDARKRNKEYVSSLEERFVVSSSSPFRLAHHFLSQSGYDGKGKPAFGRGCYWSGAAESLPTPTVDGPSSFSRTASYAACTCSGVLLRVRSCQYHRPWCSCTCWVLSYRFLAQCCFMGRCCRSPWQHVPRHGSGSKSQVAIAPRCSCVQVRKDAVIISKSLSLVWMCAVVCLLLVV